MRAPLEFPWAEPPAPATVTPVAAGLGWLRMPLPFALDHINLWLVEGAGGWTVIDTGVCRDEVKALWRALHAGAMRALPIERVIVTHFHPDHFGLAGWLHEEHGAALWMTRAEWLTASYLYSDSAARAAGAQAELFRRNGLDAARVERYRERGNAYRRLVAPPPPNRRIADGERLALGDHLWEVIVGTGHAPEHACLHCAELGVLIAGDQVLPRISPNVSVWAAEPEGDPLGEFLATLERLAALPAETLVLPSHGLPFRGLGTRIAALEAHHEERLALLAAACEGGARSAAELIPVLFERELDVHQLSFAMGESLAHLAHLAGRGVLRRERGADGIERYRRSGR